MKIDVWIKGQFIKRYTVNDYGAEFTVSDLDWEKQVYVREKLRKMLVDDFCNKRIRYDLKYIKGFSMYLILESKMNNENFYSEEQ